MTDPTRIERITLDDARLQQPGFLYLASPYSKYPGGLDAAFEEISRIGGELVKRKIPFFSPISHTHPIAHHAGLDKLDHTIWLPCDAPLMEAAHGMLIAEMETWDQSYGIQCEIEAFEKAGKPVWRFQP